MIDLSNDQLQDTIHSVLNKEEGLNELLEMILNGLMKLEREAFLSEEASPDNKGNGYRPGRASGYGKELSLRIPRDRLGNFKPVLWAMLRDQGEQWRQRPLGARYPALYIDAIHAKVRREHVSSEAFYIVLGLTETMQREVEYPHESAAGWQRLMDGLKERGLEETKLVVADALTGLDEVIHRSFPEARHQKCVTHFKRNILAYVKADHKAQIATELREVFLTGQKAYSPRQARAQLQTFAEHWGRHYDHIKKLTERDDLHYYFTYLNFDWQVQSMIYTTNWVERLNKSFRRSLKIRNALPSSDAALLLLSKVAVDTEDGAFGYPIYNFKFDDDLFPHIEP